MDSHSLAEVIRTNEFPFICQMTNVCTASDINDCGSSNRSYTHQQKRASCSDLIFILDVFFSVAAWRQAIILTLKFDTATQIVLQTINSKRS